MTLAQTLGLIPRPPALLTESEWNEVHLKAQLRQDDREECPICQERFKADSQVSHQEACSCPALEINLLLFTLAPSPTHSLFIPST